MFYFIFALFLYFLPSCIAYARHKKNPGVIIVLNLFLGWTLLGWVIAFAMSFGETEEE